MHLQVKTSMKRAKGTFNAFIKLIKKEIPNRKFFNLCFSLQSHQLRIQFGEVKESILRAVLVHLSFIFLFEALIEVFEHNLPCSLHFAGKSSRFISSAFAIDEFGEYEVSEGLTWFEKSRSR